MKAPKLHRWLDLLAALLRHRFPVTFEQLIREVPAYAAEQNPESRRRTFERDKDELRKFGIPIETVEKTDEETQGYRLRHRDFYLPYLTLRSQGAPKPRKLDREGYRTLPILSFEPEELAAVADAAARVRQLGDPLLSEHAESAMRKLACDLPVDAASGGAEADDTRVVPARSAAAADLLVTLGQALESRKRVTFRYHTMGSDSTGRREVEPFGLFFLNQHWYLAARAPGEELVKNFRLNRIEAAEVNRTKPKAPDYEIPESFHLRDHARSRHAWELGAGDAVEATVAFHARTGAASAAFRLGEAGRRPPRPSPLPDPPHRRLRPLAPLVRRRPRAGRAPGDRGRVQRPGPRDPRPSRRRSAMTVNAAEQLRRVLHLIPHLADGEPHSLKSVARRAGVDGAEVLRDIQSISERFEVPGGFVEGLQIFIDADDISVVPSHFLRPMRLTRSELLALELGLTMLRGERPPDEHRAIDGALARLQEVVAKLPDDERSDDFRAASLSTAGDLGHLRSLREAFRRRRKVRLSYRKADEDAPSHRVICPYGIVFASGMWYAVAHCESSDGIRIFRLDRVEQVETLDARFESPRRFSLDALIKEGKAFQAAEPGTLRLRYSPRIARWIAEREGKTLAEDGSLTMEHPLADTDWAVRHVLQYGPEVTVLEPAEVREAVVRRLETLLRG